MNKGVWLMVLEIFENGELVNTIWGSGNAKVLQTQLLTYYVTKTSNFTKCKYEAGEWGTLKSLSFSNDTSEYKFLDVKF